MLELRPSCENCNTPLPPNAANARICSFECTFCAACVDGVLVNVCPNCGGGFAARPIRPAAKLAGSPASERVVYKPVEPNAHAQFALLLKDVAPALR